MYRSIPFFALPIEEAFSVLLVRGAIYTQTVGDLAEIKSYQLYIATFQR